MLGIAYKGQKRVDQATRWTQNRTPWIACRQGDWRCCFEIVEDVSKSDIFYIQISAVCRIEVMCGCLQSCLATSFHIQIMLYHKLIVITNQLMCSFPSTAVLYAKPLHASTLWCTKRQRRICASSTEERNSSHWTCDQRRPVLFARLCQHAMPTAKHLKNWERCRCTHHGNLLLKLKWIKF